MMPDFSDSFSHWRTANAVSATPPRHPNDDDDEDQEENEKDKDEEREPPVVREPDEDPR